MTLIQDDVLNLINFSLKKAKELIIEFDEYYPIATSIDLNGEVIPVLCFDGNDFPLSQDLISKFLEIMESKIVASEIRAYAIAYDVRVYRLVDSEKVDAIAIKIKHIHKEDVIVYYYPYLITAERKITLNDGWGEIQE